MAYWTRAKNGTVKGWESDKSAIKRASLKHLDNQTDEQVDAYFQNLNASRVSRQVNPEALHEKTRDYIEKFLTWLSGRGRSRHTISQHRTNLQTAALFFDAQGTLTQWPRFSVKLRTHLKEKDYSENHVNKIQMSVGQFWKYLRKIERLVEGTIDFDDAVGHAKSRDTPLKKHLTPKEVLDWVGKCKDPRIQLMTLLGYFASLRPQETFAATVEDFIGGHEARTFECSKVMKSINLFAGFVFDVVKQRGVRKDEIGDPKKHSTGVVSVFNKEAALLLSTTVEVVRDYNIARATEYLAQVHKRKDSPRKTKALGKAEVALAEAESGVLFQYGNRYYEELWSEDGIEGMTLKDLRRASGYWLANFTQMKQESLHLHMRHKDVQTTSLYYRRAKEQPKKRVLTIIEDEDGNEDAS